MFKVNMGQLMVIWRSFGDSKLKSDKNNRFSVPKTNKKAYCMPQSEIW